jgi:hypothetical protein
MHYQFVRDTVDQHQSSMKCRSVLLCSAQLVQVQIAKHIVFPPLMASGRRERFLGSPAYRKFSPNCSWRANFAVHAVVGSTPTRPVAIGR